MNDPSTMRRLDVFAFTPDDLPEAMGQVERAVEQANQVLRGEGVVLVVRGAGHAPPDGAGVEAAYRGLVRDADIAVVVLWCRFGAMARAITGLAGERAGATLYYACERAMPLEDDEAVDGYPEVRRLKRGLAEKDRRVHGFTDDLARPLADHLIATARRVAPGEGAGEAPLPAFGPYLLHLAEMHRWMSIPGMSGGNHARLPLDALYVRLRFSGQFDRRGEAPGAMAGDRRARLMDVLPHSPLAITGAPGAGKTTILRYVALRLARFHLGRDAGALDELGLGDGPRPVLFELRALTDELRERGWLGWRQLSAKQWGALVAWAMSFGDATVSDEDGGRLLRGGGLVLMFDGLDEVSDDIERAGHAERLGHLAELVCKWTIRVVVTCRTRAWGTDAAFGRFEQAAVEPLGREGIGDFVGRWCRALGDKGLDAGVMTRELSASPAVRRIATNPQMLTMLAVLYTGQKRLPQQRAALYHEAVKWLLERRGELLRSYGTPAEVRGDLEALAWRMQTAVDAKGRRREGVERGEALAVVGARLALGVEAAKVYLTVLEQAVGLVLVEGDRVRFHHRTFEEYLVARRLAAAADPAGELGDRAGDAGWVEVVMLTAGVLRELGEGPVRRFLTWVVGRPGSVAERAPRIGTAAGCLADLEAWGIGAETRAPVEAALGDVLPVLEDPARAAALEVRLAVAEGLGRTRDPRLVAGQRWVEIAAVARVWDGVTPGDEPDRWNEPGRWHAGPGRFYMQRWPVTVGEFEAFVEDGGYGERGLWDAEGWAWRAECGIEAPGRWYAQLGGARNQPVTEVSWYEAQAWCRWLSAHPGLHPDEAGVRFTVRLPTALEWAAAARPAGGRGRYPWGETFDRMAANGYQTQIGRVSPVGVFAPAPVERGLWDMAGNVWEWCEDAPDPASNLGRVAGSPARVLRGGGWRNVPVNLRVSSRDAELPVRRLGVVGFRCVSAPGPWPP